MEVPGTSGRVWTCAGGSPARTGLYPAPVRLKAKPVRTLQTAGAVQAAVVFDTSGRAYVADMAGCLQSFDADGTPRWERRLDGAASATPAVDPVNGRVFAGTHTGWVCALAAVDGAVLWKRPLPTASDPRITADLLYLPRARHVVVSSWGGRFHALDADSGRTVQDWEAGLYPSAGAAADTEENLYCLRVTRGAGVALVRRSPDGRETELHRDPEGPRGAARIPVTAAPVVDAARGRVWFVANDGRAATLLLWSVAAGELAGRWPLPCGVQAAPALAPDGAVWVADLAGTLHRFAADASPQEVRYTSGAEYLLAAPVCEWGARCLVGDPLGRLHEVGPDGRGRVLFTAPRAFQAAPSFDPAGNLYLPGTDRRVHVFQNTA